MSRLLTINRSMMLHWPQRQLKTWAPCLRTEPLERPENQLLPDACGMTASQLGLIRLRRYRRDALTATTPHAIRRHMLRTARFLKP
jgi:hypothetical protein